MTCVNCGASAVAGASYCVRCGSRLPTACPNCRAANPADSRFCHACGAPLSAGGLAAPPPVQGVGCPRCRAIIEPGATFCRACGLPLDEDGGRTGIRSAPLRSAPYGRPAGFWIRVVAAIIDALCLIAMEFLLIFIARFVSQDIISYPIWTGTWLDFVAWPMFVIARAVSLDIYLSLFWTFFLGTLFWGTGISVDFVDLLFGDLLIGIAYYTVGVSVWATTIGKRAVGIYVLRPDGSKLGLGRAFARYWAPILSTLILFGGFLMVAFRQDKRALHDLICDTVVVYRRG